MQIEDRTRPTIIKNCLVLNDFESNGTCEDLYNVSHGELAFSNTKIVTQKHVAFAKCFRRCGLPCEILFSTAVKISADLSPSASSGSARMIELRAIGVVRVAE